MPSKTVELAVLDTSVYIENFRTGRFTQKIIERPFLFRGISTVIHELLRGAQAGDETGREEKQLRCPVSC